MVRTNWLSATDCMSEIYEIRESVFIGEQGLRQEPAANTQDAQAIHLIVYDGMLPVACGRLVDKCILDLIAVLKEHRGNKYGDLIVRMLIRKAFELGAAKQYVLACPKTMGFYKKLGFVPNGEGYSRAGIMYMVMVHEGDIFGCCEC